MAEKLTRVEFTHKAITALRKEPYKGIHTVYSGFNEAFRTYTGEDPIKAVNEMKAAGEINGHPSKGGWMIYLPGDGGAKRTTGADVLAKMGLK